MKVVLRKKDEKKKTYALIVLGVIAVWAVYSSFFSSDTPSAPPTTARKSSDQPAPTAAAPDAPRRGLSSRSTGEFRPRISNRPEDKIDPTKVDPTLRLDLLAKVQNVPLEGGERNIFQFGQAPAPPKPVTPLPKEDKIAINKPPPTPSPPAVPPGPPPPPPINLKYYGFTNVRGENRKKAFFLDGDDILMGWEGETIKSRYKVVHVGVNSVEVEDLQFKNKQTLPLEAEAVS